jgi:hypothetical protein
MKKIIVFAPFIFSLLISYSQTSIEYKNKVYKENIKTTSIHQNGVKFGFPLLELTSSNQLILEFDDLNESLTDYSYTVIHCDHNWNPSDLNPIEYIKGFESDNLDDYVNSFNTLIPYTHYKLYIPNDHMAVLIPGNYLLYIYEGYDKEKPVLTERFYVVNNTLEIDAKVIRSSLVTEMDESQEIEITITDKSNKLLDPMEDLTVSVVQNNLQDQILTCETPDFIRGNVFEYKNPRKLSIKGGNEFRYFNTKNLKYINEKFNSLYFEKPYYIFELLNESSRAFLSYSYTGDINGNFLITSDHNENFESESEYVFVDFTYSSDFRPNADIYIYGGLSNWDFSDFFQMDYDLNKKSYTKRLLLKQGFYNYEYVIYDKDMKTYSIDQTEGNHYETENDYYILVYYKPQGAIYEEILGYKIVNTFKNL